MWDLNEESQNRNADFIWVANIARQVFQKILRLGSGPARKSVLKDYGGKESV